MQVSSRGLIWSISNSNEVIRKHSYKGLDDAWIYSTSFSGYFVQTRRRVSMSILQPERHSQRGIGLTPGGKTSFIALMEME